jgi:L-methionine (R)-S-oxide reductase
MISERAQTDPQLVRFDEGMAAAGSVDEVVAVLRRDARKIIGSDGIAVVLRDDGCCHYVAEDAIVQLWQGQRFPLDACVSGWAMMHGETVVIHDVAADPRVPLPLYWSRSIRSLVVAPIGSPRSVAALGAYWCAMMLPGKATLSRVEALAGKAAAAFARVAPEPGAARNEGMPTPVGSGPM